MPILFLTVRAAHVLLAGRDAVASLTLHAPLVLAPGAGIDLQLTVNGELRQKSNTKYMILNVAELIEMASALRRSNSVRRRTTSRLKSTRWFGRSAGARTP